MKTTVRDIMVTAVKTVRPQMSLHELEDTLLRNQIGGAPVVRDGRVVGVVSRSDVLKHDQVVRSEVEASSYYLEPFDADDRQPGDDETVVRALASGLRDSRVQDVMARDVIDVTPDASLGEAARKLLEHRVHRLLVMDGQELVGVVSTSDLVRLFAEDRVHAA